MSDRAHLFRAIQDEAGNLVTSDVLVTVYDPGTTALITDLIYQDGTSGLTLTNGYHTFSGYVDLYLTTPRRVDVSVQVGSNAPMILRDVDVVAAPTTAGGFDPRADPILIGQDAIASGTAQYRVVVGRGAEADSDKAIAIGGFAAAPGLWDVAVGYFARTSGSGATAIGGGEPYAGGNGNIAIGGGGAGHSTFDSENNIAIGSSASAGPDAPAAVNWAIAIGMGAGAQRNASVVVGNSAQSQGVAGIAVGFTAVVQTGADNGVAVGSNTVASASNSTAVGANATADGTSSSAFGYGPAALGTDDLALGQGCATARSVPGQRNIAIGKFAVTSHALPDAAASDCIAIGSFAEADANSAVAIGASAYAPFASSTALGVNANTTAANQIMMGTATETVVIPGHLAVKAEAINTVATSGAAQTLPAGTAATMHMVTLSANCAITFPAPVAGASLSLFLAQDATGSRTVTWDTAVRWAGGTAPTLTTTASKTDSFSFVCPDGVHWFGFVAGLAF